MIYAINRQTKEHRVATGRDYGPGRPVDTWQYVEADADGWIKWDKQGAPLPPGCQHEVKTKNGYVFSRKDTKATNWRTHSSVDFYRPILNAEPSEPEAPEWDGRGMPPAGCECELLRGKEWVPVEITGKGKRVTVFRRLCNYGLEEITEADATEFRPIRTAAQRAEDAMVSVAVENNLLMSPDCAKSIYAAIRDGNIPGVKLNDPKKENDQ